MVWSFFGLLASGLIAGYQKYDNLAKEEAKKRKEDYLAGLKKSYYTVLDTAVNDYINNACDLELQDSVRKDLFDGVFLKPKYEQEWKDIVANFECYTKRLNDLTNQIEEEDGYTPYRWHKPEYNIDGKSDADILMQFFMAKHGKDYVIYKNDIKEMFMYGNFGEVYNKRLEWGKYVPDFNTCFLEWKLKTLKENGFPYTFRFVKHLEKDYGYIHSCINHKSATQRVPKREMLEHIQENSNIVIPENLEQESGFILLDEFKGFHIWGEKFKGDDFYKIT